MPGKVVVFEGDLPLGKGAATFFAGLAKKEVEAKGYFAVALSGGRTPALFFEELASKAFLMEVPWKDVFIFWGDERCVPPDDPRSNYCLAKRLLLDRAGIPQDNVFRIKGELSSKEAARLYENEVRRFFEARGKVPALDLIILGLGADGHTLSLFPGSSALKEDERLVVDSIGPDGLSRVTLTIRFANASKRALFLASGREKAPVFKEVFGGNSVLPAGLIRPEEELLWYIDEESASLIEGRDE